MDDSTTRRIALRGAVLDLGDGTLVRDGAVVGLRAKPFALLRHMALHAGRVLTKAEIMDAVWPDVIVTDDSLTQAVRQVRVAIGDPDGTLLRTVHGRGYLLDLPPAVAAPGASGPRVAVLPFDDADAPAGRRPVLDALSETIAAGLARFRLLTVLSRNSAVRAAVEAGGDTLLAARRIGADYAVAGRARWSGGGLLVTFDLVAVADGRLLLSERHEVAESGFLGLADLVPRRVVSRLFATLRVDGSARAGAHPPERLPAFEAFARGLSLLRSFGPGVNEAARDHFARAAACDPGFGPARSYWALAELAAHDYRLAPQDALDRARAAAEEGLALSPDDSTAWRIAAYLRAMTHDLAAAEAAARRAIDLNPCDAPALLEMAIIRLVQGYPAECLDWLARSEEIDPLFPDYHEATRSQALYDLGRYEEAAQSLLRLPRLSVRQWGRLAATYAQMGDRAAALRALARAEAISPGFDLVAAARQAYGTAAAGLPHLVEGLERALALRDAASSRGEGDVPAPAVAREPSAPR